MFLIRKIKSTSALHLSHFKQEYFDLCISEIYINLIFFFFKFSDTFIPRRSHLNVQNVAKDFVNHEH